MSNTLFYGKEVDLWAVGCIMGEITDGQPLFPGETEIDQLYVIQKVLGSLPTQLQEEFKKNPRFIGLKFPDIGKPETLERKYVGKLSKKALSLMKGLLNMDPRERFDSYEALMHPYFDEVREPEVGRLGPMKPQRSRGARSTERATKVATAQGGDRQFNFANKKTNNASFENQAFANNTPTQFMPNNMQMQNLHSLYTSQNTG